MEQKYLYSKGMLERIVDAYSDIYGGIPTLLLYRKVRDEVLIFALYKAITGESITNRELADLVQRSHDINDLFSIAEFKADFDRALNELGKGNWQGDYSKNFKKYKYFGRLQRIIISQMMWMTDYELEAWGFNDISRLRGTAYSRMLENLNRNSNE